MASTKTEIINLALAKLSRNTVASTTEDSEDVRIANAFFDHVWDEVIVDGYFACTIKRANLTQLSTTPAWGYDYEYQLPNNPKCLHVISLNESFPNDAPYSIEGHKLLTDESAASILYKASIDINNVDIYLKTCVADKLAAEMCIPLTGDKALYDRLMATYEFKKKAYSARSGSQGSSVPVNTSNILDQR